MQTNYDLFQVWIAETTKERADFLMKATFYIELACFNLILIMIIRVIYVARTKQNLDYAIEMAEEAGEAAKVIREKQQDIQGILSTNLVSQMGKSI